MLSRKRTCSKKALRCCITAAFTVVLGFFAPSFLSADEPPRAENAALDNDILATGLNSDRKTLSTLKSLRERQAEGNTDQALDEFRRLRTSDPHSMVPVEADSTTFVPLFRVLFRVFHSLPEEVRRQQKARDGAIADQILQEILGEGSPSEIPDLVLQAPGSDASLQGHLIVARLHLDRNHNIAARAWLQPLLLENVPQRYRSAAEVLLRQLGSGPAVAVEADSDTNDTALDTVRVPSHVTWQFRPVVSPKLNRQMSTFRRAAVEARAIVQTTWTDLLDDEALFRRTMRGLVAIDRISGKPKWQFPLLPAVDGLLAADRTLATAFKPGEPGANVANRFQQFQYTRLADVFCRDNVQGRISADAKHTYLITTDPATSSGRTVLINRGFGTQASSTKYANGRLIALEKSTGRRVWSAGMEVFREHFKTESDSCWICGPPTESRNRLYCVVEWAGEMRLACLAALTGEVLWTTGLSIPDQAIRMDPIRRLWGAVPKAGGGLIWAPTTTGWTACVDEITRSVVWASPLRTPVKGAPTTRVARGRPVAITSPASLAQRWSVSRVERVADLLVVLPHESHEIAVLDALTGRIVNRTPVKQDAIVLHVDNSGVIYAEPTASTPAAPPDAGPPAETPSVASIKKLSVANGEVVWNKPIPGDDGLPTGAGAELQGRLLIPMSTGRIIQVDAQTGQIGSSENVVLPVGGWGRLSVTEKSDGELLYSAPDVLLHLSVDENKGAPESPLELAAVLMDSEKWQEAIDVLRRVPESDPQIKKARTLQFRCRQALAMGNPEQNLDALKEVAETPEQKVRVGILEVERLNRRQKFEEATTRLLAIIQQHPILLSSLTDRDLFASGVQSGTAATVHRPLLSRAVNLLSDLLSKTAATDSLTKQLSMLPVSMLLRVNHPAVRPVLHERLRDATFSEEAIHILYHTLSLRRMDNDSDTDAAVEAETLVRFLASWSDAESGIDQAVGLTLKALILELPSDFVSLARELAVESGVEFPEREAMNRAYAEQMSAAHNRWTAQEYQTEPVMRVSSVGNSRAQLYPSVDEDPLLRQYRWTAVRGDFGRLHAVNTTSPDDQWSVPGVFGQLNVYSSRPDFIRRNGSQVLLQTYQGVSAVSLAEQRAVWSIAPGARSAAMSVATAQTFENFVAGRDRLPSAGAFSQVTIVGAGQGWVFLKMKSELTMVESLTGTTIWSTQAGTQYNQVIAGDDVVIISGVTVKEPICLDRRSGAVIDIPDAKSLAARAIVSQGPHFVCWKSSSDKDPAALEWVRPRSGTVDHRTDLGDMKRFSFTDDATCVGFTDNRVMQVASLLTRKSQTYSFATADDADAGTEAEKDGATSAPPRWTAARLQMASDGIHYLISNKPTQSASSGLPSGRRLLQFEGDLRAVNRATGEVAWTFRGKDRYLATTDQPELPVLIIVNREQIKQAGAANTMAATNHFYGVARASGESVFKQVVSSQYGLRYMTITSPRPNVIDLSVYGQRLRLSGAEARPDGNADPSD